MLRGRGRGGAGEGLLKIVHREAKYVHVLVSAGIPFQISPWIHEGAILTCARASTEQGHTWALAMG